MKKAITIFSLFFLSIAFGVLAEESFSKNLSGKILLQVESRGEAWYVNPTDLKRYYMGKSEDAYNLMRNFGVGITNNNLEKIPVGTIAGEDNDKDGLENDLEEAIGTNPANADSDNDGYNDDEEIKNNYNPLGVGKLNISSTFSNLHKGKIFLQVEKKGEAWYINPTNSRRYYLGRAEDALNIMKKLSLGITNNNLNKITTGSISSSKPVSPVKSENDVIYAVAEAIRSKDTEKTLTYFTPEMKKAVEYTMNFLNDDGILTLGNILSGAKLTSSNETEKVYSTEVYFSLGGYNVPIKFHVNKQADGKWLMTNL